MEILSSVVQFAVCAVIIVVAGTYLAKCPDAIAEITKFGSPLSGNVTLLGISPGLWVLAAVYIGGIRIVYLDQRVSSAEVTAESHKGTEPTGSLSRTVLGFVAAAAVILIVGPFMAHAAENFSKATGLGRTFVGTTLIALSTSQPVKRLVAVAACRSSDCLSGWLEGRDIAQVKKKIRQQICRTLLTAKGHAGHEHRPQSITDTKPVWRGGGSQVSQRIFV